jgi:hypothetical protein
MSALPPKADMCGAIAHVCFGPIADISIALNMSFTLENEHNRSDYRSNKSPTISLGPNVVAYTKSGKSLPVNERIIVALVGHDGSGCGFHIAHTDKVMIMIVTDNIAKESRLHANERCFYFGAGEHFAAHMMIRGPSGEYVRGNVHHNAAYQTNVRF